MSTKPEDFKYQNWVFTWNSNVEDERFVLPYDEDLENYLKQDFDLYVFQLEKGEETGRLHYQGAFRTKIRVRQATLLKKFKEEFIGFDISYLTINRMCGEWSENVAYCTKEDTRVGDKYYSSISLRKYSGRDLKVFESGFYPWQEDIFDIFFERDKNTLKTPHDREIYWFTDPNGNCGKSKFIKYLCFSNSNITKLSFGTASQLRSSVVNAGPFQMYLVDIPRTLGQDDSLDSVISVLEDIKNGFVVSSMYGHHKTLMMDPPHVICFSNEDCPTSTMSADRWKLFRMSVADKTAIKGSRSDLHY